MRLFLLCFCFVLLWACEDSSQKSYTYDYYPAGSCDSLLRHTSLSTRERVLVLGQWVQEHLPPPLPQVQYMPLMDSCLNYALQAVLIAPDDMQTDAKINLFAVYVQRMVFTVFEKTDRRQLHRTIADLETSPQTPEQKRWYHFYKCTYYAHLGAEEEQLRLLHNTLAEFRHAGDSAGTGRCLGGLVQLYSSFEDYSRALSYSDTCLQFYRKSPGIKRDQAYLRHAVLCCKAGRYDEAVRAYRHLDTLKTTFLAKLCVEGKRYPEALNVIRVYRQANKPEGHAAIVLTLLEADALEGIGQDDEADRLRSAAIKQEETLAQAIRKALPGKSGISSDVIGAYVKRANYAWRNSQREECMVLMGKAVGYIRAASPHLDQRYPEIVRRYSEYCQLSGRYHEALPAWQYADSLQKVFTEKLPARHYQQIKAKYEMEILQQETDRQRIYLRTTRNYRALFALLATLLALSTLLFALLYHNRQRTLALLYQRLREQEEAKALNQRLINEKPEEQITPDEQVFRKLEERIRKEVLFADPGLNLEKVCLHAKSNRSYISALINRYAGVNFNQWINAMRIEYILAHIDDTDPEALARQAGFSSRSSLYRAFKATTGLTLSQYVKQKEKHCKTEN